MAGPFRSGKHWLYVFRLGNEGLNVDKKTLFLPPKSDWNSLFVIVGVVNGTAVFVPYQALERGTLIMVAPLIACYPLITLIPNQFFLGRVQLSLIACLGLALIISDILLLLNSLKV